MLGRMNRSLALLLAAVPLFAACPPPTVTPHRDGGGDPPVVVTSAWTFYTLDDSVVPASGDVELGSSLSQIAIAVAPNDTVGVAYFRPDKMYTTKPAYDVRYVDWKAGTVGTPADVRNISGQTGAFPQYINAQGISVAFSGSEPAVAYFGGHWDGSPSPFWYQGDAAVAVHTGGGWQPESLAARDSSDAVDPSAGLVSSGGQLVGIFPSLVASGATYFLAYRDVHYGQSAGSGDYTASELELAYGGPGGWNHEMIQSGASDKGAYGGHSRLVMGDQGDLGVLSDHVPHDADGTGFTPTFRLRHGTTWSKPVFGHDVFGDLTDTSTLSNTQSGAVLAYDSQKGYGAAVVNRGNSILYYAQSKDPLSSWTTSDPVVGEGTGGWYPSLAFDPVEHEPNIAYYFCSASSGKNEGQCTDDDALKVAAHVSSYWTETTVDPDGAFMPQLAYLSNGKRVIAYRVPRTPNVLRLAVEK